MNPPLRLRRPLLPLFVAAGLVLLLAPGVVDAQLRTRGRGIELTRPAAKVSAAEAETKDATAEAPAEEATAPSPGLLKSVVRFIRANGVWIITGLVLALAAVGWWALRGGRESDIEAEETEAVPGRRFSSTRISASDIDDRLEAGPVAESEVETDREYALVVDEDALKMPPLPDEVVDEHTGRQYAESGDIRKLLEASRFTEAYERYIQRIERDTSLEFHSQLEQTLSEYFLRKREFDKVTRILEHHVSTHAETDVEAETWFNLGYAHVFQRDAKKSQRCFERFCEKEDDPKRVARARQIIEQITRLGPLS